MAAELLPTTPQVQPSTHAGSLKRLRLKHRRVLALHLQGVSNDEIARTFGFANSYVSQIINSQPAAAFLEAAYADFDKELRALVPRAVDAMRRNVDGGDPKVELHAAELILKANRKFDAPPDGGNTAENVIERILDAVGADGTRIRYAERSIPTGVLRGTEERQDEK